MDPMQTKQPRASINQKNSNNTTSTPSFPLKANQTKGSAKHILDHTPNEAILASRINPMSPYYAPDTTRITDTD